MTTLNADQTVASDLLLRKLDLIDEKLNLFLRMQGKMLTRKEMLERYDVCNSTLNKRIAEGTLPQPNLSGVWMAANVFEFENNTATNAQPLHVLAVEKDVYMPLQSAAPTKFGLYKHFDAERILLYVGVSVNAVNRLIEHQKDSHWAKKIAHIEITYWQSRRDSLMAERQAIVKDKPLFNKQHSVVAR